MTKPVTALTLGGALGIALLAAGGCDKLPWASSTSDAKTTAAQTTAQSAVTPAKPLVPPDHIMATVNGAPISKKDVELRIQELKLLAANMNRPWTALTPEQLASVVDELINNELMSQDAVKRGVDRQTETQGRWEYVRRGFFVQEWLRSSQERANVSSQEVEGYYEQNKLGFRVPERRKLRQLVVAAEDQAKQALAQLLGGSMQFSSLAQQISLGPTAAKGGLLDGWVMRANEKAFLYASEADAQTAGVLSLDPALEAAAFAIDQVNGLSNHVKGSDGRFHLFQLVEREPERQRPLTEVWNQIKSFLELQRLQQALNELRTAATVERFPERLDGVVQD